MSRKFTLDRLLVATHNAGKLEEMHQLFQPLGVVITGAAEMNLAEPERDGKYLCRKRKDQSPRSR